MAKNPTTFWQKILIFGFFQGQVPEFGVFKKIKGFTSGSYRKWQRKMEPNGDAKSSGAEWSQMKWAVGPNEMPEF